MRKITLTNDFRRNRTSFENAKAAFIKFCKLKNLTERTIEFYEEDLMYLQNYVNAKYLDEITQETLDDFILAELDKGIGSEQKGRRPVMIIQNNVGNKHSATLIVAVLTGWILSAIALNSSVLNVIEYETNMKFFSSFGTALFVSSIGLSTVVALTLSPALCSMILKSDI
mgnify:CR=1 FL=1